MSAIDAQLLAELIDRHGAALKLYARCWCNAADDVVQQALIDLAGCRSIPANPAAWLFTVVRRRAISWSRSNKRRLRYEEGAAQRWFERRNRQDAAAQAAAEALADLLPAEREIIVAHVWGGLTFKEIARLVGTSTSTTQRQYDAAINRMRERTDLPCPKRPI